MTVNMHFLHVSYTMASGMHYLYADFRKHGKSAKKILFVYVPYRQIMSEKPVCRQDQIDINRFVIHKLQRQMLS